MKLDKGPMSREAVFAAMGCSPPKGKFTIAVDSEEEDTTQPTGSASSSAMYKQ